LSEVSKRPLVKIQPLIPVLHKRPAGYFNQAILWEMMASMSAKPTQSSFPLYSSLSSKSYIAIGGVSLP